MWGIKLPEAERMRMRKKEREGKLYLQGHPERMLKVNPFARALIFTKSGFSGVFWDEK